MDIIKSLKDYTPPEAESPWLKFVEGTTTVRILSHSVHWKSHYIRGENKSYDCAGSIQNCEWCQKGSQPRSRWAYLVLNRDLPEIKVMEIGWSIFETILELAKDKDYGNVRDYDIKITRKGSGLETKYTVIPGKNTDFTEAEGLVLKAGNLEDIDKATEKLLSYYKEPSQVKEPMNNGTTTRTEILEGAEDE